MNLKSALEKNPIFSLGSTVVTAASITASAVLFLMNQRIADVQAEAQRRVDQYQVRLGMVQRDLEGDFVDVGKIVVRPSQFGTISEQSVRLDEDRCVTRSLDPVEGWSYRPTTELDLIAFLQGKTADALSQELAALGPGGASLVAATRNSGLHAWFGNRLYRLSATAASPTPPGVSLQFVDMILLQRKSHDEIIRGHAEAVRRQSSGDGTVRNASSTNEEADQLTRAIINCYQGDATGVLLIKLLELEMQDALASGATFQLNKMQKIGGVVYLNLQQTYRHVRINDRPQTAFQLQREMFIVSTATDLYIVKTVIPMPQNDSRVEAQRWINSWLSEFRILDHNGSGPQAVGIGWRNPSRPPGNVVDGPPARFGAR